MLLRKSKEKALHHMVMVYTYIHTRYTQHALEVTRALGARLEGEV